MAVRSQGKGAGKFAGMSFSFSDTSGLVRRCPKAVEANKLGGKVNRRFTA